ncbi:MAG: nickel pincer cofactor biosynthesis protein LarC [Alphaproteobacteria bacterium]|nr:nickel pincer cofactor biosynthesis protein LarC [Alphaproteobacteria bacterium]MBQ9235239.1 nickel pincer cofactor biosynthesis protein LarC [Alphaproteobacteria bacterium]
MTKYLFFDGNSGISGDMTVAALLDMGGNQTKLAAALASLPEEFHYHITQKNSYSIAGTDFSVHHHEHPAHEEEYNTAHHHHPHHHHHRHLADVVAIIDAAAMSPAAKTLAKNIFSIIAAAEAKAHGVEASQVHFHEVGAIDSIVDIVAAAVLLDDFGVEKFILTGLTEGQGTVMCQHGQLPIPVPAVLNIAQAHGIILRPSAVNGEMVTPTGIALLAALSPQSSLPEHYKVLKTGIGLGKRDFGRANFLRIMLVEDVPDADKMYVVESNIDDSTPEELGWAMERLFAAGALDVHFEPCYMKKCRPAYMLRIITTGAELSRIEEAVFRHTSTIGLRKYPVERSCMDRKIVTVNLPQGQVKVKISTYHDIVRCQPEYESVKELALRTGENFRTLFAAAQHQAETGDYNEQ